MKQALFFRLDVSPTIGLGHLRRCLVLAQECQRLGAASHFLIRRQSVAMEGIQLPKGGSFHEIPWEVTLEDEADYILQYCQEKDLEMGVLDHYRFDGSYQSRLAEGGIRWMQFGNLLHKHSLEGDLVHDARPGAKVSDYTSRMTNPNTRFLAGPSYALVGEPFRLAHQHLSAGYKDDVQRILLIFGGGDDRGATLAALEWLEDAGYRGSITILTTSMNPSLPILREKAAVSSTILLRVDDWNPAPQMALCQLVITAGGASLYELACMGLPALIVCIADNQFAPAQAWKDAGFGELLGGLSHIERDQAAAMIRSLLHDHKTRKGMAQRCLASVDGVGAFRTAVELLK